jgi:hypothetical protein
MKRIAALAAVMIGLLAIPTAAMASTGSPGDSGRGYGTTVSSIEPYACHVGFHRVHHHFGRYFWWRKGGHVFRAETCPLPRPVPQPQPQPQPQPLQCQSSQTLTFSVAADSSVLTEVSGPELYPTEEFVYDGNTYTVMTVNPGANQFTAFVNNFLFTNHGAAITSATGALICGSGSGSS